MWWDFIIGYFIVVVCSFVAILFFEWGDSNDITLWSIISAFLYSLIPLANVFVIVIAIMAIMNVILGAIFDFGYYISFNSIEKMKSIVVISGSRRKKGDTDGRN